MTNKKVKKKGGTNDFIKQWKNLKEGDWLFTDIPAYWRRSQPVSYRTKVRKAIRKIVTSLRRHL